MQLPFSLRLSLLGWSCALIFSGFALAGAAFLRMPELFGTLALVFLAVSIVTPVAVGLRIKREIQGLEAASHMAPPELPLAEEAAEASRLVLSEESSAHDDEEALRRMQKAQAVDRLRDGITHDLNNRLMVISANIDSVARQMKEQPILQRKLLSALVASDQAAKLIAKSADFARQNAPKVQNVDLTERVSSVAALMSRSLLRDTVELRLSLDEGLWPIEADPNDLETAVVTLSAHARDALRQGGTITIEARNVHIEKGTLTSLDVEGDFVQLVIRSNGPSETQPDPDDLGEQAFSLKDLDLSPWLNLSQSLHFLRSLGGASEVRHSGSETAIVLYLPRAKAALLPSSLQAEDESVSEAVSDHTEILVVDDEVEVAQALQSMLEEFGYVTRIATDAGQAIKSLKARKPGLLLTDVAMPGTMNGVMLAREVRQVFPDLPVLLITGNPVVADQGSEFPLLQKPIVSRDLHAVIQRHLRKPDSNKVVPLFPRARRA